MFRNEIFKSVGDFLEKKHQMITLDLDLVLYYTTALIGLYPRKLIRVKRAVESGSICQALRKEFESMGEEKKYKKPYVKVRFYSVIFSGGAKAVVESILESLARDLGLTEKELNETDFYEQEKANANKINAAFNQIPMVKEFREMSNDVAKNFNGETFIGLTGYSYPITSDECQRSFAGYLQS